MAYKIYKLIKYKFSINQLIKDDFGDVIKIVGIFSYDHKNYKLNIIDGNVTCRNIDGKDCIYFGNVNVIYSGLIDDDFEIPYETLKDLEYYYRYTYEDYNNEFWYGIIPVADIEYNYKIL